MQKSFSRGVIVILLLALIFPSSLHAAIVGRFTQVTGQVDRLKQGKIPAVAAKVQDGVEQGDVIRTKSGAKAQLTMVDDSIITLAPESRLAIADYQYIPAREERRAVVRIFRGLVQTVVKRIIKREQPDFVIETHTALIGVRGSNPYFLLMPGFTSVYLPQGLLEVRSNNPDIPFQVLLRDMEFTQIPLNQQPKMPQALPPAMLQILEQMMTRGIMPGLLMTGPPAGPVRGLGAQIPLKLPVNPDQIILQQTIPPVVPPPHAPAPAPAPAPPPSPSPSPPSGPSVSPGP
jgi:hypothetical protein